MFGREEKHIPQERKQELFFRIRPIIAKQLEINESTISLSSKIVEDLGADSLDAIEVIMALEEEFNIEIPDKNIDAIITMEDVVMHLARILKP